MSKYCIKLICFCLCFYTVSAQDNNSTADSTGYYQKYGLRVGADVSKLLRSVLSDDYSGFEINADYRLKQDLYVAGEIGLEEKRTSTPFLDVSTNGSYIKAGVDVNLYRNWFGMDNLIFAGARAGFATFSHDIDSYEIYTTNTFWEPFVNEERAEFSGLSAIWAELMIGIKAQVLNNVYVGLNAQLKMRITETEPDNFENLYIPGFGRTYDSGNFGVGYGYTVSYLIPLYKRSKTSKPEVEE